MKRSKAFFGLLIGLLLSGTGCRNPQATGNNVAPTANTTAAQPDKVDATPAAAKDDVISLFITAQIVGTTEPCGCSSEPLGDVSRIAALYKEAGGRGLLLDGGGLRYKPIALPAEMRQQARLKADFLESTWQKLGALTTLQVSDLGGTDGLAELGPRLASNVSIAGLAKDKSPLRGEEVRTIGGVKIGIFGLAAPEALRPWPAGVTVSPPIEAAQQAVARLRGQGVGAIVAITGLPRDATRRLLRKVPEINLAVAGGDLELHDGAEQAEAVGESLLVVPAVEGQRLVRVDLHLDAKKAPVWTLKRTAQQLENTTAGIRKQLAIVKTRLEALRKDPQAEPAFVQTTEAESARLSNELTRLSASASERSGAVSGYVTAELLPIGRKLPRDREVASGMAALDRRIGEANLASLSAPPPAPPGTASYVGLAGCQGACHFHDDAVEFWQKTQHAKAFPTLVEVGKELSYDCVSCHVVGFDMAGGSNLWSLSQWQKSGAASGAARNLPDLRSVQCEVCHGPGSLHVSAPSKNPIPIARPTQERCLVCHTKDHSDTFDFVPYLRDIVGPGHGAERRAALGQGATGKELRSAALKKSQSH